MNQFIFFSELNISNLRDTWDTCCSSSYYKLQWDSAFENVLTASDERQTDRKTRDLFFFLIIIAGRVGGCSQILIWEIFANSRLLPTAEIDALKRTRLDFFGIWKKLLWVWSHGVHLHIKAILYHSFSSEGKIRYNTVCHTKPFGAYFPIPLTIWEV